MGGRFKNDVLPIGNFQDSPWLVVEVDESDGTIEKFTPDITVVLNYDWDHVDQYEESGSLQESLQDLLGRTKIGAVLPENSDLLKWVKEKLDLKISTFANQKEAADFMISNQSASVCCASMMGLT